MFSMVQCFKRGVWVSIEEVIVILKDLFPNSWEEDYEFLLETGYILENEFLSSTECLIGYTPFYFESEQADVFALNDWSKLLETPSNKTYPEKYDDFFEQIFYIYGEEVKNYYVQYFI